MSEKSSWVELWKCDLVFIYPCESMSGGGRLQSFQLVHVPGKDVKRVKRAKSLRELSCYSGPSTGTLHFNRAWSSTATNHVDVEALNTNITHCLLPLLHLPRCFLLCVFSFLGYGWESAWCQDCSERFYRIGLNTSSQIFLSVNISEFLGFFGTLVGCIKEDPF